jgi:hypothetical protein
MAITMDRNRSLPSLHDVRAHALRRALAAPPTFEQALASARESPALAGCAEALTELLERVTGRLEDGQRRDGHGQDARDLLALREAIGRLILERSTEFASDEVVVADDVLSHLYERFFGDPRVRPLATSFGPRVVPLVSLFGEPLRRHAECIGRNALSPSLTWVRLPVVCLRSVWLWPCLAHEMGHDLYAAIAPRSDDRSGYASYLEAAVADQVARSVHEYGYGKVIALDGAQPGVEESALFLAELWRRWCDEAHADTVAILQLGPAAAAALQEALPGRRVGHTRDPHPPDAIRSRLTTRLLARLRIPGYGVELDRRMPLDDQLILDAVGARYRIAAALADVTIAAAVDALLTFRNPALGGLALPELLSFSATDQECVEACAHALLDRASPPDGALPRHLLAAARLAFERRPDTADALHTRAVCLLAEWRQ